MTRPAGPPLASGRARLRDLADWAVHQLRTQKFLRFLIVGGFNTAVGYGLFLIALAIMPTPFTALVASTIACVLVNFQTLGRLVFGMAAPGRIVAFFGVYGLVFAYNAIGLDLLVGPRMSAAVAGFLLLPGAVAISYILNNRLVFRKGA